MSGITTSSVTETANCCNRAFATDTASGCNEWSVEAVEGRRAPYRTLRVNMIQARAIVAGMFPRSDGCLSGAMPVQVAMVSQVRRERKLELFFFSRRGLSCEGVMWDIAHLILDITIPTN